ncbi:MAG TPA: alpha/beta fold hydrolase [Candidatus Limnocylindrales bacterium]
MDRDLEAPIELNRRPSERPPGTRPIRKDEIDLVDRGVHVESWLPERRTRRRPLLLVHGELGGSWVWHRYQEYFAQRGWEAHAVNLRGHYWSDTTDYETLDFATYVGDATAAAQRLGGEVVVVGHDLGGLIALKVAEAGLASGLVLISPAMPGALRPTAKPHQLRAAPEIYRRDQVGWAGLPEAIRRRNPDLTIADVLRIQHMMGAESGLARRDVIAGIEVDRSTLADRVPALVIGGGLDREYPEPDSERLAEWLGAEYQPYGAHSHYGLVIGEESFEQIAADIRSFLDANRL